VCLNCGKVIEFEDDEIERKQLAIADKNGIKLTHHSLYLYGECVDKASCEQYKNSQHK
jgi:Fur family ferric uptake transcriptional regulator